MNPQALQIVSTPTRATDNMTAIINDICETLSLPGKKIEIAKAKAGGSQFNQADAYEKLNHVQYVKAVVLSLRIS